MSLSRYSTEQLVNELNARVVGGKKQSLPVDTRQNHTLLERDSRGRFKKSQ